MGKAIETVAIINAIAQIEIQSIGVIDNIALGNL